MKDEKNKAKDKADLNPFPDEAWIGCPHCEEGIDICAPIARARRDVGEFVLSLIMNGVQADRLTAPLERLNHDCMYLEDAARRSILPLSHLDVYDLAGPCLEEDAAEESSVKPDGNTGGAEQQNPEVIEPC